MTHADDRDIAIRGVTEVDTSAGWTLERQAVYTNASSKAGKTSAVNRDSVSRRAVETNWANLFLRGYFLQVCCITTYAWILAPIHEIVWGICSRKLMSCVFMNTLVGILRAAHTPPQALF